MFASMPEELFYDGRTLCLLTSKLRFFGERVSIGVSGLQRRLFA
jgi:hypothetical protein